MKDLLLNNLSWKLGSVLAAFIIWLTVMNVANPSIVSTREVPVKITNEEVLEDANLTYKVISKATTTISFKVRARDEYRISADDFYAYADLSELYDVTGAIPIKIEVTAHRNMIESVASFTPEVIRVETEPLQRKTFDLTAYPRGEVASGYMAGDIRITPSRVEVRGPQSMVGQISSVGIDFDQSEASEDITGTATPGFYDANGNPMSLDESVTISGGDVVYTMKVLRLREVPLNFIVAGNVAEGYRFTGAMASQASVTVAGEDDVISPLGEIRVQDASLNVEGATSSVETDIDITNYLPANVVLADENTIHVTLDVEPLREERLTISREDISLIGENSDYSYFVENTDATLRVRGLESDISGITSRALGLTADVTTLTEGVHTVRISAENQVEGVDVMAMPVITVEVRVRGSSTEASTATEAGETEEGTEESGAASSGETSAVPEGTEAAAAGETMTENSSAAAEQPESSGETPEETSGESAAEAAESTQI